MEIVAWTTAFVVVVAGWSWTVITVYDLRKKNDALQERVLHEGQRAAEAYGEGYQKGVETSSGILSTTVTTTVSEVTRVLMGQVVGDQQEHKIPPPVTDQTPEPSWFTWEDQTKPVEEFGAGDSVWVPREFEDRVAGIADGESIIPGVPLPDMSGEDA